MNADLPLLSIVIPTRNRTYYCIQAIRNILNFNESNFELIIQDNSDSYELKQFCENCADKRLIYHYTQGRINSAVNMDMALGYAKGEYVIMIGDDDIVLNNIFQLIKDAKIKGADNIIAVSQFIYIWPKDKNDGVLEFRKPKLKYSNLSLEHKLTKLLNNGLLNYSDYALPRVYHGIIKRKILDKIKQQTGGYINALSPDIYLTVACSMLCSNLYISDVPFSIAGACPASSTAENIRGEHRGEFSKIPHLFGKEDYKWNPFIPKVYSIETIWADSALKCLEDFNHIELTGKFRQGYFMSGLFFRNRPIRSLVMKEIRKTKIHRSLFLNVYDLFRFILERIINKVVKVFANKDMSSFDTNVGEISSAVTLAKKYI